MKYYAFIAGLPDLILEERHKVYTVEEFKNELDGMLSKKDKKCMADLFLKHDNDNLLSYLKNSKEPEMYSVLGTFSEEDIAVMLEDAKNEEWNKKYPEYMKDFLFEYFEHEDSYAYLPEDRLAGYYYRYLCDSKDAFLREWSELNMNIRNILTVLSCRREEIDYEKLVVGDNEVANHLRTSHNPSHGLVELIDYYDEVKDIDETLDLLEKEQKIDALLWEWIDENTFFHYFDLQKIMGYLFKLQILERWRRLDPQRGEKIFRELVSNLKKKGKELENFGN